MKIKFGFISNSSSTSYVVAINKKDEEPCPHCGQKKLSIDIIDLITNFENINDDNDVKARGNDEIINYINKNWGPNYLIENKGILEELFKYDEGDWQTYMISLSYHNETLNKLLKDMINAGTIHVIYNEND
jgi:hypothetical protein